MNIKDLPLKEQPSWRVNYQAEHCTLVEVLAALLGGKRSLETAQALVAEFQTAEAIAQASPEEIAQVKGMTTTRASSLKAAIEFARRVSVDPNMKVTITSPDDAYQLVSHMADYDQEHLVLLLLNTRNTVIGEPVTLYKQTLNSAHVRIAEVFRPAIKANAASMVIAHNHPSGDPAPSPEDISMTRTLVEAGKMMDIEILDHIIVGRNSYISLKSQNLGFN
jgi:DNA repair protein RadC